jgi:uncharacterized protein with ParB-like and HNH nuclease domain
MPMFSQLTESTWNTLFDTRYVNGLKDVDDLGIKMLKIPQYQRAYVWDQPKIAHLLNSIIISYREDKPYYFLGNIVLCKEDKLANYGNYFIVDGQQRITSMTIIISTIRFIAREFSFTEVETKCDQFIEIDERDRRVRLPETRFKLCLPDTDKINYGSEFRNYIQMSRINELRNFQTKNSNRVISEYVERLQDNTNKVYDILHDKNEDFLYNLVRYISGRCKFIMMVTDQFLDAHRIFCTLNIAGEPLSPLDFYRARFYGHMVREKGLREANRSIDAKLKIWNKMHAELGNKEMKYFLAHVYRIRMAEASKREEFMASFGIDDDNLLLSLSNFTDNIQVCEEFFKQVTKLLDIWTRIFKYSEMNASKEALKLLRYNHWEIWVTVALVAGSNGVNLNKEFWVKLEKYMSVMMVLICSRYASVDIESNEILSRCYKDIRWLMEFKELNLIIQPTEMEFFVERICGEIYTQVTDYCLVYLMMRISLEKKNDVGKFRIENLRLDLICPMVVEQQSTWTGNDMLIQYASYIGNFILVDAEHFDKFKSKDWLEKKTHIGLVKTLSLTSVILSQPVWGIEQFRESHNCYLQILGKIYDIHELKVFQLVLKGLKRKFNAMSEDEDVICVLDNQLPDIDFTPKPVVSDYDIALAASSLSQYLRDNKKLTVEGIKNVLLLIDEASSGFADDDTVFKLILRLQKQYRMFARKWQSTFRNWVREANIGKNGCFYPGIFLTKISV